MYIHFLCNLAGEGLMCSDLEWLMKGGIRYDNPTDEKSTITLIE